MVIAVVQLLLHTLVIPPLAVTAVIVAAVTVALAVAREVTQVIRELAAAAVQLMAGRSPLVVVAAEAVAEAMQPIPVAQVMLAQMQTQQLLTA
jgi:hypothetical protein